VRRNLRVAAIVFVALMAYEAQDARAQAEYEAAAQGVPALKAAALAVAIAEEPTQRREERDGKVVIARG
jgi:hypothetical protein